MKRTLHIAGLAAALLATVGVAAANDPKPRDDRAGQRDSERPVDDTWITTKVKSALLAERDVSGLALEVETVNGVVHLRGRVDDQAEADRAQQVARGIEGVERVDLAGIIVGGTR